MGVETRLLLDQEVIDRLKDLARDVAEPGEDVLGDLLETYREDLTGRLKTLDHALGSGDLNQAAETSHALKGASLTVGAAEMATLMADSETLLRAEGVPEALMPRANDLAKRSLAALSAAFAAER